VKSNNGGRNVHTTTTECVDRVATISHTAGQVKGAGITPVFLLLLLRAHIGWWGVAGEVALLMEPVKMIKGQPLWNEGDVGGYGLSGFSGVCI
jgi:hypothetical protein